MVAPAEEQSLPQILVRYRELTNMLGDPEVAQNSARMSEVLKERGRLVRRALAFEQWLTIRESIRESAEMLEDPDYQEIA